MRSVDEQLGRALAAAVRPAPVRVAISEAQGLLCAEEVVAERALPGFDQAAVDGYAVRSVDVRAAGNEPVLLPVVGEIPAGSRQPRRLQPGQAVRVDTGAPLPTLADAVVPRRLHRRPPRAGDRATSRCPPPRSSGAPARTCRPVTSRCAAVRRSVRRRSACSPRSAGPRCSSTRGRGCRSSRSATSSSTSTARRARARSTTSTRTRSPPPPGTPAPRSTGSASCRATPRRLREIVEGRLLLSEIVVIAGGVGGEFAAEIRVVALRARRHRHDPGRHASRLGAGLRPARPGRRADLPAAQQPDERARGVRGDGPPADPRRAGQAQPAPPRRSPRGCCRRSRRPRGARDSCAGSCCATRTTASTWPSRSACPARTCSRRSPRRTA